MAQLHTHSPAGAAASAVGREKRRSSGGEPKGYGSSWPSQDRAPAPKTRARRSTKPRNPDCSTDKQPHRRYTRHWLRERMTLVDAALYVQSNGLEGDAVAERALDVYRKMGK